MIDRRLIREQPEKIRAALRNRGYEFDLDELVEVEKRRRELLAIVESSRAQRNELSEQIGRLMQEGGDAQSLKQKATTLGEELAQQQEELGQVEEQFEALMLELPNIPLEEVPVGQSEEDIANTIERVAARLVKIEHEARAELVRTDEHRLEDEVWRARGTVANARLMSSAEFMELASSLRLGVALGILDAPDLAALNRLLVATQPGHLSRARGGGTSPRERDIARADLVRRSLAGLN